MNKLTAFPCYYRNVYVGKLINDRPFSTLHFLCTYALVQHTYVKYLIIRLDTVVATDKTTRKWGLNKDSSLPFLLTPL